MNRFDIINRIGDKYRIGNTETGEFSYAQALKTVGKDIKDYQKATTGAQHKFLDLRFENERLAVLVECKNKFSRWDKAKIQWWMRKIKGIPQNSKDKIPIADIIAVTDAEKTLGKCHIEYEKEISRLNRLVTMFIDYAELMAEDEQPMSMQNWLDETDRFLQNNRRNVLDGKGRISHDVAVKKVSDIYAEFRKKQDAEYVSEFDRETVKYLKGE